MAKGKRCDIVLVPYQVKIKQDTKDLLAALITVLKLRGQRELIERLLKVYGEYYPQDIARANEFTAVINSIELPDPPTAKSAT